MVGAEGTPLTIPGWYVKLPIPATPVPEILIVVYQLVVLTITAPLVLGNPVRRQTDRQNNA